MECSETARLKRSIHLALLAAALLLSAYAPPAQAMVIRRTWIEHRGEFITIHVRLSGRPRWTLSPQANRLQIDLIDTRPSWPANQFLHARAGTFGTVSVMAAGGGSVRIQIEVTNKCDYVVGRIHDDVIVGLAPRGGGLRMAESFNSTHSPPPRKIAVARRSAPASAIAPAIKTSRSQVARIDRHDIPAAAAGDAKPQVQGRPVVVVDAGHGGFDPGTRSADGVLEKDLALQIASRLAAALESGGVNAIMTRDRDAYLTLAQRTAIANNVSAELFVSIHLNWSPNPQTTGMEVYYLNNTTDRATIRLARMENAAQDGHAPLDSNLNYILSDLQQQYKATESALLAQLMEQQTVGALQADFGGDIHGLGAKRGPFYVLVGPRIPAVLVECGFLSNSGETRRLSDPAYQQAMADALAASIVHYLNQDVTAGTL